MATPLCIICWHTCMLRMHATYASSYYLRLLHAACDLRPGYRIVVVVVVVVTTTVIVVVVPNATRYCRLPGAYVHSDCMHACELFCSLVIVHNAYSLLNVSTANWVCVGILTKLNPIIAI